MEIKTNAGKTYTVVSSAGCTVSTSDGTQIKELAAGQDYFTAISGKTVISDDSAIVQEVFKLAPYQKLTLLGVVGGEKLPAGYTRLYYLQGGPGQYIAVACALTNDSIVTVDCTVTNASSWQVLLGAETTSNLYSLWSTQAYYTRFDYGSNIARAANLSAGRHIIRKQKQRNFIDGEEVAANTESSTAFTTGNNVTMFKPADKNSYYFHGYIHFASIKLNSTYQRYFIPALDPAGTPCMFDTVTRQPFYNAGSGQFIVGMTAAQAVQLANLPADAADKTLTVSLPQAILNDAGEITDAAVRAALNKAADNGWDITLQYYNEQ